MMKLVLKGLKKITLKRKGKRCSHTIIRLGYVGGLVDKDAWHCVKYLELDVVTIKVILSLRNSELSYFKTNNSGDRLMKKCSLGYLVPLTKNLLTHILK